MLRILVLILANSVANFAVTLVGTVRDSSGAVIPEVTVELTAQAPGLPLTIQTDTNGQFRAVNLSAGSYQIKIAHSGFQLHTETVAVEANQTNAVEIRLEVAKIVQEARVSGKAGAGANSDPNYRKLRDPELAETYGTEKILLARDAGDITLKNGTLSFGPPVPGKV